MMKTDLAMIAVLMGKSPARRGANKLVKLLGSEAPTHYLESLNADKKPWYLRPNYDQSTILIDPDGQVRAGTPAALVERLTQHEMTGEFCFPCARCLGFTSDYLQTQRSRRTSC